MDHNQLPHIDIVTDQRSALAYPQPEVAWYASLRFKQFLASFLVFSLIGLVYVYQRPAIYQSKVALLTVAPSAVDQPGQEANIQHVAIQGNIITGQKLIELTRETLSSLTSISIPSAPVIHDMLFFEPVADTNLVELRAEGEDPEFLPLLLNTLTEQYQLYRREQIAVATAETSSALNDQFSTLTVKVEQKRDELDQFRSKHNILSVGRDENQVLTRLKGLTDSLNTANEAEVIASARLRAVKSAINKGESVVPDGDERTLANLEARAQELREEVDDLEKRYTPQYIELQPNLKNIPEQLAKIEEKIAGMKGKGRGVALAEAEENYYAARQVAAELERQVEDYKDTATEFTRRFAEHEALIEELAQLELLYRETQDRLIQIEVQQREKYPQVEVFERTYQANQPIRPDYTRDAGIALLVSFLLGLAIIWLIEFLNRDGKSMQGGVGSWSRIYTANNPAALLGQRETANKLEFNQQLVIENHAVSELDVGDMEQLLNAANKEGQLVIAGLLSGLTIEELITLAPDQIDREGQQLSITGSSPRNIQLSPGLLKRITECEEIPNEAAEAEALITCAAFDSALRDPETIDAEVIRRSYITYLIRQGFQLRELKTIIGSVSAQELAGYSAYTVDRTGKPADEINLVYPVLI